VFEWTAVDNNGKLYITPFASQQVGVDDLVSRRVRLAVLFVYDGCLSIEIAVCTIGTKSFSTNQQAKNSRTNSISPSAIRHVLRVCRRDRQQA
jgi:hypothetical protein